VASSGSSDIQVHVQSGHWSADWTMTVPDRPAPIEMWLPLLQDLANQTSQAAAEASEQAGRPVSCQKGCDACCRQLVGISLVEARALARLVAQMPEPRQGEIRARFAAVQRRLAESGVLQRDYADPAEYPQFPLAETERQRLAAAWFSLQIACPFLENEACSIYQDRPLVCRGYLVTSPADACSRLFRDPVRQIKQEVRLGSVLARTTAAVAGVSTATIPIAMALQLPAKVDAALGQLHDPREMLEALLGEIGEWRIEPAP